MSINSTHPLMGVQERRRMANVSAKQAAAVTGLALQSYYRLERGERVCPLPRALKLAQLIGCTVEQLGNIPTLDERIAALRDKSEREIAALRDKSFRDEWSDVNATTSPRTAAGPGITGTMTGQVVNAPPQPIHQPVTDEAAEIAALVAQLEAGFPPEPDVDPANDDDGEDGE
jgi:DNA-binding XRE family transcriptional regulator